MPSLASVVHKQEATDHMVQAHLLLSALFSRCAQARSKSWCRQITQCQARQIGSQAELCVLQHAEQCRRVKHAEGGQWACMDAALPPEMLQKACHGAAHNLCPVHFSGGASSILPLSMAPNRRVLSLWKYKRGFFWLLQWLAFTLEDHFAPSEEMLQLFNE